MLGYFFCCYDIYLNIFNLHHFLCMHVVCLPVDFILRDCVYSNKALGSE